MKQKYLLITLIVVLFGNSALAETRGSVEECEKQAYERRQKAFDDCMNPCMDDESTYEAALKLYGKPTTFEGTDLRFRYCSEKCFRSEEYRRAADAPECKISNDKPNSAQQDCDSLRQGIEDAYYALSQQTNDLWFDFENLDEQLRDIPFRDVKTLDERIEQLDYVLAPNIYWSPADRAALHHDRERVYSLRERMIERNKKYDEIVSATDRIIEDTRLPQLLRDLRALEQGNQCNGVDGARGSTSARTATPGELLVRETDVRLAVYKNKETVAIVRSGNIVAEPSPEKKQIVTPTNRSEFVSALQNISSIHDATQYLGTIESHVKLTFPLADYQYVRTLRMNIEQVASMLISAERKIDRAQNEAEAQIIRNRVLAEYYDASYGNSALEDIRERFPNLDFRKALDSYMSRKDETTDMIIDAQKK